MHQDAGRHAPTWGIMFPAYSRAGGGLASCSAQPRPALCSSTGNAPRDAGQAGGLWEQRGSVTLHSPTEHSWSAVASWQGGDGCSWQHSKQGSPAVCWVGDQPHSWHNSHLHSVNTLFLGSPRAHPRPDRPMGRWGWPPPGL